MKWLKNNKDATPNSYWDTTSDIMSSLLLVLLLVIMLMILYVVRAPDYNSEKEIPESEIINDGETEQYVDREAGQTVLKTDVPYLFTENLDEEYGSGEQTGDFEYEDGGFEDGEFDGHAGAAVQVIVQDAQTHNPIREEGITFGLYTSEGRRTRLYSYYPTRTAWTRFSTDESGTFYMPQKLVLASYILHEMTVPAGYEATEDVTFTLEEPAAWNDPYILHVQLKSVRNTIHFTAVDSDTGAPVAGCTYDVIAAEDIKTKDGAVRYASGTVVDQITMDDNGEGRSNSLYLGSYTVTQSAAPEYYAVSKEKYEIALGQDKDADGAVIPVEQQVRCEKTCYTLNVVDELYHTIPVAGAVFTLTSDSSAEPISLTSDENGKIKLDGLNKATSYTLTQNATADGYQVSGDTSTFYVDKNGRIADECTTEEEITNRTLRLAITVKDVLFGNTASDCRVDLYNDSHQLVNSQYSSDVDMVAQGMTAGKYQIEISGTGSGTVSVEIEDTAQVQQIVCSVWTTGNKLVVGGSAAGLGCIGGVAGFMINRSRKKKKRAAAK